MIRLNVFIQVSPENRAAMLEVTKELVEFSLQEVGCVAYDVYESATRPHLLLVCETWADELHLGFHNRSEHFLRLIPKIKELGEMKVDRFDY